MSMKRKARYAPPPGMGGPRSGWAFVYTVKA